MGNNKEFESVKKEYEKFKEDLLAMYDKERDILNRLQEACPHLNKKKTDNSMFSYDDDDDKDVKYKCSDCFAILD